MPWTKFSNFFKEMHLSAKLIMHLIQDRPVVQQRQRQCHHKLQTQWPLQDQISTCKTITSQYLSCRKLSTLMIIAPPQKAYLRSNFNTGYFDFGFDMIKTLSWKDRCSCTNWLALPKGFKQITNRCGFTKSAIN